MTLRVAGRGKFVLVVLALLSYARAAFADDAVERCADSAERGQAMRRAGRFVEARMDLLQCADRACPAIVRGDCARWADETQSATPSIVVRASAGSRDVVDVRLFVDGALAGNKLDGKPLSMNPGEHVVRAQSRAGEWSTSAMLMLASGERNRVITLRFQEPSSPRQDLLRKPSTLTWLLGGFGLAASLGGGVAYGLGSSERAHLIDSCADARVCSAASIEQARSKLVVGDVLVGVGVVAMASALILYLVAPHTEPKVVKTSLLSGVFP